MLDPITQTLGVSTIGLVTGFIFRLIGEGRKSSEHRQMLMLKALGAADASADNASKRAGTGWLRWFFAVAVVAGVVIAPIVFSSIKSVDILYPVQKSWSVLWGLWTREGVVVWQRLSNGYPVLPAMLQAFNLYISFVVGQKPAK